MTTVEARYFPATVRFSGGSTWQRTYVVAARGGDHDGLHIWRRAEENAAFRAGIDWTRTKIPTQRQARNGVSVFTDVGLVVVTLGSGCRCGQFGKWRGPSWANTVQVAS